MSETFSIILTGEILPEHNIRDVVPALAQLLKTTEEQAIKRLTGRETVIKRNVAGTDVERYIKALSRVGVKARHELSSATQESSAAVAPRAPVAPVDLAPPPAPAPAPALEPMTPKGGEVAMPAGDLVVCPQCGHEQPKRTLCLQCSCDMPRMRAAQAQMQLEDKASQSVFQAPRAALVDYGGDDDEEFATPKVLAFSMVGRLGRLRYLAYSWAFMLLVMVGGIFAAILVPLGFKVLFVPLIALVIAVAWIAIRLAVLRLHDLNLTGKWLFLPMVLGGVGGVIQVPAVVVGTSIITWLSSFALMLWPGSKEGNDYGPPCGPNSTAVKVLAGLALLLSVIGVFGVLGNYKTYQQGVSGAMSGAAGGAASDFSNPVYAEIRIKQSVAGREMEMLYLGKMASDADCRIRAQAIRTSFSGGCNDCEVAQPRCTQELSARDEMLFDNEPIHTTYLSMAAGDATEREGRIVFWGLTVDEGNQVCQAMQRSLQRMQKGLVSCITATGG